MAININNFDVQYFMVIPIILFGMAFIGLFFSIIGWKFLDRQRKKLLTRISYLLAFLGIIISFYKMEYYSDNLITSFALLLIGFTVSEIYDRMKR